MYIRRCRDMRTNHKIEMLEQKLKTIGTELEILIQELENKTLNVEQEEIINQLVEIQDFTQK